MAEAPLQHLAIGFACVLEKRRFVPTVRNWLHGLMLHASRATEEVIHAFDAAEEKSSQGDARVQEGSAEEWLRSQSEEPKAGRCDCDVRVRAIETPQESRLKTSWAGGEREPIQATLLPQGLTRLPQPGWRNCVSEPKVKRAIVRAGRTSG